MNRNALSKKFYRLWACTAAIPPMVIGYMLFQGGDPWTVRRLMLPVLGVALYFCCLGLLVNLYRRTRDGLALQLDRFFQESQKRNAELNALRDLTELTRDGIAADDLLTLILDKAMQMIAVRNGSVFLVDPARPDGLRLVAANPPMVIKDDGGDPKSPRSAFVKSVIENGKTMRVEDIGNDPRTMKANNPRYGSPSFISMPVYKNRQVIAVMNLANKENGDVFTEGDERILTIMLGTIGVGIENSGLRSIVRQQLAQIKDLTACAGTN